MASGKLTGQNLRENVLNLLGRRRKEVLVGANLGGDCASLLGEGSFVVHTDPITGATQEIGSLAVKVVLNDVAAGFGEPIALLLTLLLPESMDECDVKRIMLDAENEAKKWNAEIIGGHTEFTDAVNRPIVNAVGIGKRDESFSPYVPQIGDEIIVTKNIALEGSFILAEQYAHKLNLTQSDLVELKEYTEKTSVMLEAKLVRESGFGAIMHDVTEGGILGALAEICDISNVGLEVDLKSIPVSKLTQDICHKLNVNPYKLISSGSMIIISKNATAIKEILENASIKATIIGKVTEGKNLYVIDSNGEKNKTFAERDEMYRKIGE